jgi:hypothetical protein
MHPTRTSSAALVIAVALAACTATPLPSSTASPIVAVLASPAAAVTTAPLPTASPDPCPNAVADVVDGPSPAGDDFAAWDDVSRAQGRLEHDRSVLQAYAEAHRDEFTTLRLSIAPVRLVIGFTDHVIDHCLALRPLLDYPNEFRILHYTYSADRLEAIRYEIGAMGGGVITSIGVGRGYVDMDLRADSLSLAKRIWDRYGPAVRIKLGMFPYPPPSEPPPSKCGELMSYWVPRDSGSLVATLTLWSSSVRSGRDFSATVTIRNRGTSTYLFQSGADQYTAVFRRGTFEVVGIGLVGGSEIGYSNRLKPGEVIRQGAWGGTASCDPAAGYAVPPGTYDVRAVVERFDQASNTNGSTAVWFLSHPTTLVVTP